MGSRNTFILNKRNCLSYCQIYWNAHVLCKPQTLAITTSNSKQLKILVTIMLLIQFMDLQMTTTQQRLLHLHLGTTENSSVRGTRCNYCNMLIMTKRFISYLHLCCPFLCKQQHNENQVTLEAQNANSLRDSQGHQKAQLKCHLPVSKINCFINC